MASKVSLNTTFTAVRSIEPFYTGGEIEASRLGKYLACTIDDEDCTIVDLKTATPRVRIDGDGEAITSIALTPNASHVVVCSRSLSMRIFQLNNQDETITAELTRTLKPHNTPVVISTTDSTGSLLVTGAADGTVKVWDIRGGYCSHTFHGHGGVVTALELFEASNPPQSGKTKKRKSQDSAIGAANSMNVAKTLCLASAGEDGKVKIWDLATRKNVASLDSHTTVVKSLRFCEEKQLLLSASRDRTLVLWDSKTWSPQRIIAVSEEVEAAEFISNGNLICSGGENGVARIWSTMSGTEIAMSGSHSNENDPIIKIISLAPESAVLIVRNTQVLQILSSAGLKTTSDDLQEPLEVLQTISGNHDEIIDMVCCGAERSLLALADNTESPKVVSIADDQLGQNEDQRFGSNIALLEGHSDVVLCLDTDSSGQWLATGSKDNTARLWKVADGSFDCVATFAGHTASVGAVALPKTLSSATKTPPYLITGSEDKTVKKWDTSKIPAMAGSSTPHDVAKAAFTRVAHEKDINAIDASSIAPLFASASQDRTIKVWSADDASTVAVLRGHKRGVWSVRFSPAGAAALSLAEGGSSGSRGLLASGSGDNTIKVWSLNTYTCLLTFEGHQNSVLKVLWLPVLVDVQEEDSREHRKPNQPMIASASSDTLVKLWSPYASADSDHLLTTLDNHTDRVWSLATPYLSLQQSQPDAKTKGPGFSLISGAADAKLSFWRDTTAITQAETSRAMNERIEQDQMLQNHILARNYREVITLSLALNHPGRLLRVFEDVVNLPDAEKEANTIMGVKAVDEVLGSLSQEEVYKLLERVRDWNTNARTSGVAQKVLNCLLKAYPQSTWIDMAKNKNVLKLARSSRAAPGGSNNSNSMKDMFRALEAYTDKHYKRMEDLIDESYLLEYTLREMDEVAGSAINESGRAETNGDVIMV